MCYARKEEEAVEFLHFFKVAYYIKDANKDLTQEVRKGKGDLLLVVV